jgi:hypothetical protein
MGNREPLTIGRTEALITDPDTGKYPYPSLYSTKLHFGHGPIRVYTLVEKRLS